MREGSYWVRQGSEVNKSRPFYQPSKKEIAHESYRSIEEKDSEGRHSAVYQRRNN